MGALGLLSLASATPVYAQTTFAESFTGTTAPGWTFGGNYTPNLTANTIDAPGDGWLRLTDNATNRSTYALLDTEIFSVNARIEITMDYTFWNGSGADGITFFLVDGSVNAGNFSPGAYGGSMGYANGHNLPGMTGGYLGFALDNYGNYSNPTEDRLGGTGFIPNTVAVRGPESSGYAFIDGSGPLQDIPGGGQMDFPSYTTRPDQTGADYRSFKIIFDANNQLEVLMQFGASNDYISVFTADLSAYERPETFKIGFTGATGGSTEIHEVRNVSLVSTPWSSGSGAYEWDNGSGTTTWGTSAGTETNNNWFSSISGNDNKTPTPGSDILFGNKPSAGPQTVTLANNVQVRNVTFDTPYNYTLNGPGTITFGKDADGKGLPSINVNNYNESNANGLHKINNALTILENIAIRNFSYSTLCLNGPMNLGANTLTTSGYGLTNLNGVITGSGPIVINGASSNPATGQGIVTISGNNSGTYTGTITVNNGQLVALHNNALGTAGASTAQNTNLAATAGATSVRVSSAVATNLSVGQEVFGAGIAPGTYITAINVNGTSRDVVLSKPITANIASGSSLTYASGHTTVNSGGTLTLRSGTNSSERLFVSGTGATLGRGEKAGALYNDGGTNTLSGPITLIGNTSVGSRDGNLILSGVINQIGGTYDLTKIGDGVVTLSGSNTYAGATRIEGGALRVTTAGAMNNSSNLVLAGGVLEVAHTNTFTEGLGTGGTQLRWDGDGGFSAHGGDRTVNIGSGTSLTWASTANFVADGSALLLSSAYSDSRITLQNDLRLNNGLREIRVADGAAAVDGRLSGHIRGQASGNGAGSGGIIKTGEGTLELSNTNNNYGGATIIRAGALRGITGSNSNIQLDGGVRELNANYASALGTTGGLVQWLSGGGLAADTANRSFNVGGNAQALIWAGTTDNSQYFVRNGQELILGSRSTSATLTFANAINLNNAERTIRVIDGIAAATTPEAIISGAITNGSLVVTGNGRLDLTNANNFAGPLTIVGSEVRLGYNSVAITNGTLTDVTNITVRHGGALSIDNTTTNNNTTNRVHNDAAISLQGGTLNLLGRTGDHNTAETIGVVTLSSGANTINVQRGDASGSAQLTAASLVRTAGTTVDFTNATGGGTLGATGDNPRAFFTAAPTQTNGILAYATVNGTHFATVGANGIEAAVSTDNRPWGITSNSQLDAATAAFGGDINREVNSLRLNNGGSIGFEGRNLNISSGGLLSTGNAANSMTGAGTLTSSSGELIAHVYGPGGLTINPAITNSGSTSVAFTKSGDGVLTLSGTTANTFTGATTINAGTLVLAKSDGVTALSSTSITVGDGRGIDTLRLGANEQINNAATVTLRGGEVGNSANVARLEMNGAANDNFGSRVESFATLHIEGNAVLDFGGGTPCSPTFLYLDVLSVATNALLTITNWIEFTDFLLVSKTTFDSTQLSRVIFDGYGGEASWKSYDSDYYQIIPYSPVPEPGAYGVLALGGLLGLATFRRRRRTAR